MRPPEAAYDSTLNVPSVNQQQAIKSVFEFIQELRRQASFEDEDSPDELTAAEIFTALLEDAPELAVDIIALVRDETALAEDGFNLAVGVTQQLAPLSDIG